MLYKKIHKFPTVIWNLNRRGSTVTGCLSPVQGAGVVEIREEADVPTNI